MLNEGLIPLKAATAEFPERDGKRPHLNTLRRWIAAGVKGKRLRAKRVGGVWFTSRAWIEEFLAPAPGHEWPAKVVDEQRAHEASAARLAKRGIYVGSRKEVLSHNRM